MNTIIFDIDGTLLESTEFDSRLYVKAVREVLGHVHIHDDWDSYLHVTDAGILDQILRENAIETHSAAHRLVRERFSSLIQEHLGWSPCVPVTGALEMIEELRGSGDWQIGLATGGWKCTALAKLNSAGIDITDIPISSSDDSADRRKIMRICNAKLEVPSSVPVYIGDGPWDLRASKDLGWRFIAIGERLKGMHDPWIQDYSDPNRGQAFNRVIQADASGAADF